jgi:predicted ATPase/DNA-binding SARP family transcriptional activator/class 3 adenylate cyclase
VTLLFTDIEGSTRLLHALGERYGALLADHHRVLRRAFDSRDGRELGTAGDAFFFAFQSARDAVEAAIDAQRRLAVHRWPAGADCRVRMGIHTGEPTITKDGYHGIVLHRVARIADAGHGGQILLSGATAALVADNLPAGVALRPLGEQQLKDMSGPESLFQVVVEGLPSEFPPLRVAGSGGRAVSEVRLLGSFEVLADDGVPLKLPGGKPRALLALLALEAGRVVSVDRLIDGLWGEHPPATAPKVILGYVSRLRKLLPPGLLETRDPGYVLNVVGRRDLDRFEAMRAEATALATGARWRAAAERLAEALALWRGPPLADVARELVLPGEVTRLEELRQLALEERIDADLALGREAQLLPELEALIQAEPLRERPRGQLMLTLYRLGRQSDALNVYRQTRHLLVEELGIEPGGELQRLERQILRQDEALAAAPTADRLRPLPASLTPLVGRLGEIDELGRLLGRDDARLVTLVGPGGVGKTRLALAVAELRAEAVFVELASVGEPALVRSAIAGELGLKDEGALVDWLRSRDLLLVLDNFEHLLDAAPVVPALLAAAPGLHVLATSREPLDVRAERVYTVAPLPTDDAVDLFIERAAAAGAEVGYGPEVVEICRRLDCLPLAMELAAARARTLEPGELLERLGQRLELLTRGPRDLPERQRTLRATIEWSHNLLDPEEQQVFARLGVFAGGCTLELAESVCGARRGTLESLVDKSLLRLAGERFSMLETIREYANERLDERGELEATTRRLAEHLCHRWATFAALLKQGERIGPSRIEDELDNIRAVIRASLAWQDDPLSLRLVAALVWFWEASGRTAEGLRWTVAALERASGVSALDRAEALQTALGLATAAAQPEQARAFGEEALALYRAAGEEREIPEVMRWVAHASLEGGDPGAARRLHAEAVALSERLGNPVQRARVLRSAGEDELEMGDPTRAAELLSESLELARSAGAANDATMTLHSLGDVALVGRDPPGAGACYLEALSASVDAAMTLNCLAGLAGVAALDGLVEVAGRLWGAVESRQRELGEQVLYPQTVRRYEPALALVAGDAFERAAAAGTELSLEQASREAFETLAPRFATGGG